MTNEQDQQPELLKLVLLDIEKERDRLRDARASFTALLGPLPASAAVVTGIIASAADRVEWWYVAGAAFAFALLVAVSVRFGALRPYRELRADRERTRSIRFRSEETDLRNWLEAKIELEEQVYGDPGEAKHRWWPAGDPDTLAKALNSERAAAGIVQALFLVILAVLIVGIAIGT